MQPEPFRQPSIRPSKPRQQEGQHLEAKPLLRILSVWTLAALGWSAFKELTWHPRCAAGTANGPMPAIMSTITCTCWGTHFPICAASQTEADAFSFDLGIYDGSHAWHEFRGRYLACPDAIGQPPFHALQLRALAHHTMGKSAVLSLRSGAPGLCRSCR